MMEPKKEKGKKKKRDYVFWTTRMDKVESKKLEVIGYYLKAKGYIRSVNEYAITKFSLKSMIKTFSKLIDFDKALKDNVLSIKKDDDKP